MNKNIYRSNSLYYSTIMSLPKFGVQTDSWIARDSAPRRVCPPSFCISFVNGRQTYTPSLHISTIFSFHGSKSSILAFGSFANRSGSTVKICIRYFSGSKPLASAVSRIEYAITLASAPSGVSQKSQFFSNDYAALSIRLFTRCKANNQYPRQKRFPFPG